MGMRSQNQMRVSRLAGIGLGKPVRYPRCAGNRMS